MRIHVVHRGRSQRGRGRTQWPSNAIWRGHDQPHLPRATDRRETIPYQIIAPERGVLSDPPLITRPITGLRQRFPSLIPARPYCADVLGDGLRILEKKLALERRHIQLNGPASFRWMPHDIDHANAYFAHRDANLPDPTSSPSIPRTATGILACFLAMPVARHAAARIEPLNFYGAVERGIARRSAPTATTPV